MGVYLAAHTANLSQQVSNCLIIVRVNTGLFAASALSTEDAHLDGMQPMLFIQRYSNREEWEREGGREGSKILFQHNFVIATLSLLR